jgi:hypothetical protein
VLIKKIFWDQLYDEENKRKTMEKIAKQRNLRIHNKTTDLIVRIQQERNHNKPPCGAPRGVVQIEAGGRRSGPCPDPWRRHQPFCPPAPSDQAPPRAPAPRSPKGNEISLKTYFFLILNIEFPRGPFLTSATLEYRGSPPRLE